MKYLVHKSSETDSLSNWYHKCVRQQIPFVSVCYRTKLADVEFDYITFNATSIDDALRANAKVTSEKVFELFDRYKNNRSSVYAAGWAVIQVKNIEIGKAEQFAQELYDFILGIIPDIENLQA